MKSLYPCNMMQDLMPLYYDGVCSRESAEAVKKHLSECYECRKYYEKMCAAIPGVTSLKEEDNLVKDNDSAKESNSAKDENLVKERNLAKDENLVKEGKTVKNENLVKEGNSSKDENLVKEGNFAKDENLVKEGERERQKAASFRAVRKQLRKRQIFVSISGIILFCLMAGIIVIILRYTERKISYSANLTVTMTEEGLIGRLKGDTWDRAHTKRVDVEKDGQNLTYLFFYLSGNLWDALFTNKDSYMDYIVCPEDKGAEDVDCVYYYTGDYSGIEMMGYEQLQEVVKDARLLWSSEGN